MKKRCLVFHMFSMSMERRICLIDKGKNGHNEFTTGAKIPFSEKKKDFGV